MRLRAASVDAYLAQVASEDARAALRRLRAIIRDAAPGAEEVISYGIPTFKQHGFLIAFAAFPKHCSLFPGHTVSEFADDLKDYKTSKGTIRFTPDRPIPERLVRALVAARLAENEAASAS